MVLCFHEHILPQEFSPAPLGHQNPQELAHHQHPVMEIIEMSRRENTNDEKMKENSYDSNKEVERTK